MEKRIATSFKSCHLCAGLFMKSSGKLTCGCNIGYNNEIGDACAGHVGEFVQGPLLQYIRTSYISGYEPFERCARCLVRRTSEHSLARGIDIHIEPVNFCQLSCLYCTATAEKATKSQIILPSSIIRKMFTELSTSGVLVNSVIFVGYGEPLFNPELPTMIQFVRSCYPLCEISIDTNANFIATKAADIANCGASLIKLSIDGVDQVSYGAYRNGGNFEKAINFARVLAESCRSSGSTTRLLWKYILFNHNDSDEQIRKALQMSIDLGIEISFDVTCTPNYSRRPLSQIRALAGSQVKFTCTLDERIMRQLVPQMISNLDVDIKYY
jgi:wyosine [tRNA(Phe)-imidazoG37] synthetase (radical SAM superfamily)